MTDHLELEQAGTGAREQPPGPEVAATETATNGHAAEPVASPNHHAEAGRKGARRVHQLIQAGRLYEQEHGLKRGRQRLRQLIEEGKLYEREHGVRPGPRSHRERATRVSRQQLVTTLLQSLVRLAKPSYRAQLLQVLHALESVQDGHA